MHSIIAHKHNTLPFLLFFLTSSSLPCTLPFIDTMPLIDILPLTSSQQARTVIYGMHTRMMQDILDMDYLCNRPPSLIACISTNHDKKIKLFWWDKEILLPCYTSRDMCYANHQFTVLINMASKRSAIGVIKTFLTKTPHWLCITIGEWIPEQDIRNINAMMKNHPHHILIGPSTNGLIVPGKMRAGYVWGRLETLIAWKLFQQWSLWVVTKSGWLLNELCVSLGRHADWVALGCAVGGDRFPLTSMADLVIMMDKVPHIRQIIVLGEVWWNDEHTIADMIRTGTISTPVIAHVTWISAEHLDNNVQFGHAGALAQSHLETATAKNKILREAWARVGDTYEDFLDHIYKTSDTWSIGWNNKWNNEWNNQQSDQKNVIPQDVQERAQKCLNRQRSSFTTTISDERWSQPLYNGHPISTMSKDGRLVRTIGELWFKRTLPDVAQTFLEQCLIICADHGPAVVGAHNTITTARSWTGLISSLVAWLSTIGPRFGWAITGAARNRWMALDQWFSPSDLIAHAKRNQQLLPGIGHKIKSRYNPDIRCTLLEEHSRWFTRRDYFDFAMEVADLTMQKKHNLILNVDGTIGALLLDMMKTIDMTDEEITVFLDSDGPNALFVLSRTVWLIGHYLDQQRLNEWLYRTPREDILYAWSEDATFPNP